MAESSRMEKIVSLCKRRGFIFQSSEIYGGLNGTWDYGPMGAQLKKNIKDHWWREMTQMRDDIVGMDGAILMSRAVWRASGHETTFSDPMVDCLLTKKRYRADQVEPQSGTAYRFTGAKSPSGWTDEKTYAVLIKEGGHPDSARKLARQFYAQARPEQSNGNLADIELLGETTEVVQDSTAFNPENGGLLSEPRSFNLMFKTYVGPVEDESNITYLRPETAQAMFVQFKNVLEVSRKKLPFGICQIGKAFRNEINPRNFTFRSREFEQMEVEFFVKPGTGFEWVDRWLEDRLSWYERIGLPREKIHVLDVPEEDRAFYSKKTYDLEYAFPFGVQELEGIAYRTDYDLSRHQEASGKPLEYFDEETKERYIPHVVEPSGGVDRTVLAVICEAFDEQEVTDEKGKTEVRTVLHFAPSVAPIKVGIFPLLKNKPELVAKAREVEARLRPHMATFYDETGAIGRRYRRQDEVGTPFGITIDFETLEGVKEGPDAGKLDTVTLRHRDSMAQERISIEELPAYLLTRIR
ncbi:MAG: glycine--tRNA ligase [Pseudomonadales bacterium]|nr:glycine--tRNA ligase [Pseudomonadales bacterium]